MVVRNIAVCAGLAFWVSQASSQQFYLIQNPAGLQRTLDFHGISNTGIAVGRGSDANGGAPLLFRPLIWDRAQGLRYMTDQSSALLEGDARDITPDGQTVTGYAYTGTEYGVFLWNESTGLTYIDTAGGALPFAISNDASVVVGKLDVPDGSEAFRWTQPGGLLSIGELGGGDVEAIAHDVSGDGTVIVGETVNGRGRTAFRWTQAGGMKSLDLARPEWPSSEAHDASYDGSFIVGTRHVPTFIEPFIWSEEKGMVGLGFFGQWFVPQGMSITDDGSKVAGVMYYEFSQPEYFAEPFFWTEAEGYVLLKDILVNDFGVNLTDWQLMSPMVMSGDGHTVAGKAYNRDTSEVFGFVAFLTPQCAADTNLDGMISPADFSAWVAAFNGSLPMCDQNGDFECTPADFSAWVANFNAGC